MLSVGTALLLAGSLGALIASIVLPCAIPMGTRAKPSGNPSQLPSSPDAAMLSLSSFEDVMSRRLQAPLYDPPPKAAPPPKAVQRKPPPQVRLLATMIEPGLRQAMFSDPRGNILIRKVGQQVSDQSTSAELVEISDNKVVLRHGDQLVTMIGSEGS